MSEEFSAHAYFKLRGESVSAVVESNQIQSNTEAVFYFFNASSFYSMLCVI
jgi:hypothetical protein